MMSKAKSWLVLIPTELEQREFPADCFPNAVVELCGFGPIAAAARTAFLLEQYQPTRVMLIGIAGSYGAPAIASATEFDSVICDGVGVGAGAEFQTASELGWSQWASASNSSASISIGDEIQLSPATSAVAPRRLLTVCSASADGTQAEQRKQKYSATAEDMEGFGVALSCKLQDAPLTIVRGMSNIAGDREHKNWKIAQALAAAADRARKIMGQSV